MHVSTVDISIRTLNSSGTPTSSPDLYGVVRNSLGIEVETLTLEDLTETAAGVYEISDYDVSNSNNFPGTFFTIFWCSESDTVSPEVATQKYIIYGTFPTLSGTRLLTWCPSYRGKKLYGYEVRRRLKTEGAFTLLARTVFPYYFDVSTYSDEEEFQNATFQVRELIWESSTDDEPGYGTTISEFTIIENNKEYCELYGSLVDVTGGHSSDAMQFYVHEEDTPQIIQNSYMLRRNEVIAPINHRGEFQVPLIQGTLCTVECSDVGLSAKFVVPCTTTANLKDLTLYPIDNYRAQ